MAKRRTVVSQFVADLQRTFSQERLDEYRPAGGSDLDMIVNYFWDIELAQAIVPCLHAAELALRNSVHNAFTAYYGTEMWFYQPGVLEPGQLGELSRALGQLSRRRAQPTSGRIVAELTSGFWVTVLSDPYHQRIWQPDSFAMLRAVFPHSGTLPRQVIQTRFNSIRKLRNRVFHFEAIWDRPDLLREHTEIHEAIGWISPTLQQAILAVDHFPQVAVGREHVETDLKAHLEIP
jgi:hypothetical protein